MKSMQLINIFTTFFHYLVHPFRTHEIFMYPERFPNENLLRLSPYESLSTSWIFVLINSIFRIIILNFILVLFYDLARESDFAIMDLINLEEVPALYFIVLSSIIDVIFYPLFGIFLIQFWELIIRFFGKLNGVQGDLTQKAADIMSVSMSSKILSIVPFIGGGLESLASLILMYAGLRTQLNASVSLSLCILFTPVLLLLAAAVMIFMFVVVLSV